MPRRRFAYGAFQPSIKAVTSEEAFQLDFAEPCRKSPFVDKNRNSNIQTQKVDIWSSVTHDAMTGVEEIKSVVSGETPIRSGLRIHDIIDVSSNATPKTTKRKADAISDVLENEVRMWASATPPSAKTETSTSVTKADLQVTSTKVPSEVNLSATVETRPTKRVKKFVERLGYAALGGAAVGAGLFSVLVATAPDFL